MSLKEALLGFIDNVSLPSIFSRKSESLKQLRQPLLKGIGNAKRQFESGQTRAPHRWWKVKNEVVALTVKLSGHVFHINGVETNHIPAERFADFLDKFAVAVEAGEFDDELRNKGAGDAKVRIPRAKRVTAKADKPAPSAEVAPAAPEKAPPPPAPVESAKPARRARATKAAPAKAKRKPADPAVTKARAAKAAATRAANKAKAKQPAAT